MRPNLDVHVVDDSTRMAMGPEHTENEKRDRRNQVHNSSYLETVTWSHLSGE